MSVSLPARIANGPRSTLGAPARRRSLPNAAIAEELVVTEKAVVSHTSHIYAALGIDPERGVHRRVLAVLSHLAREDEPTAGDLSAR